MILHHRRNRWNTQYAPFFEVKDYSYNPVRDSLSQPQQLRHFARLVFATYWLDISYNWSFGFHNRRSAWPSRQKRGYRNARTFFSFKWKIRKNDQKDVAVHVKCHSACFFFHKCLCQNSSYFFNRRKSYFLNVRNQSIFYNQLAVFRTNLSGIV